MEYDPFLKSLPFQRRLWSANSLAAYMACPRRYYYQTVRGLVPAGESSADLTFGTLLHKGADVFTKALASGASTETATELAYTHILEASEGWGGEYRVVWRCDGRIRGDKGRPVKCPRAKLWNPTEAAPNSEVTCPKCGETVKAKTVYFPSDKTKNRATLMRSLVAYCDAMAASQYRPYITPDGRIGAEWSFIHALPLRSPDGDLYLVSGTFDQIVRAGEKEFMISEIKTTKKDPSEGYYNQFVPGVQLYLYSLVGRATFPGGKTQVLKVVVQVGVGFTNVYFRTIRVPPTALDEFERELLEWIERAEADARAAEALPNPEDAYIKNPTSCHSLPGAPGTPCVFRSICRMAPEEREAFLQNNFRRSDHSPIDVKGAE